MILVGKNKEQEILLGACKYGNHGEILSYAFAYETIYWAVGDYISYDKEIYGEPVLCNQDQAA